LFSLSTMVKSMVEVEVGWLLLRDLAVGEVLVCCSTLTNSKLLC
jgi:hypothetical protein